VASLNDNKNGRTNIGENISCSTAKKSTKVLDLIMGRITDEMR
jgi:hypothetical protein